LKKLENVKRANIDTNYMGVAGQIETNGTYIAK
jgi:hypothetical protein